jgi:hypothetical protein
LSLQVSVAIILAGSVMAVATDGLVGSQLLQPILIILMEPTFSNVDQKNTVTTGYPSCSRSRWVPPILP